MNAPRTISLHDATGVGLGYQVALIDERKGTSDTVSTHETYEAAMLAADRAAEDNAETVVSITGESKRPIPVVDYVGSE